MVSRAYDDKGRATAVGTVNFAGDLGKMIAPLVAGLIAVSMGWRATFMVVGLAGTGVHARLDADPAHRGHRKAAVQVPIRPQKLSPSTTNPTRSWRDSLR